MSQKWTYSARISRSGRVTQEVIPVDPTTVPPGCALFDHRWQAAQALRRKPSDPPGWLQPL
jgi:hypothetical protein